jgi:hypothetical protein
MCLAPAGVLPLGHQPHGWLAVTITGPLPTGGIRVGLKRFNSQLGSELAGYAGPSI